jgi:hypothetical protein
MGSFSILMAFWFALVVVGIWRRGNLQDHCLLAVNLGTWACKFAAG